MVPSSSRSTASPTVLTAPAPRRLQPSDDTRTSASSLPASLQNPTDRHPCQRYLETAKLAYFLTAINTPDQFTPKPAGATNSCPVGNSWNSPSFLSSTPNGFWMFRRHVSGQPPVAGWPALERGSWTCSGTFAPSRVSRARTGATPATKLPHSSGRPGWPSGRFWKRWRHGMKNARFRNGVAES